jgi:4-diphosphocytidyl-2-C-methyl-D-erythritol kinase
MTVSATIEKQIPVAAGLGGGSSDAATALRLGNELLGGPLHVAELHTLAAGLGSDVPFFLADGPQLGLGDGSELTAQTLPDSFTVVLALAHGAVKISTAQVYAAFDERDGAVGFEGRRTALLTGLLTLDVPADLARLARNDLASSALSERLEERGAFRADVSGAGPVVYGLFEDSTVAAAAARAHATEAEVWVTRTRWER